MRPTLRSRRPLLLLCLTRSSTGTGRRPPAPDKDSGPAAAADGHSVVCSPADAMQSISLVSKSSAPQRSTPEPQSRTSRSGSRIFDLFTATAKVGVNASALVAGEITNRTVRLVRVLLPGGIADGPLQAIEHQLGRQRGEVRRSEQRSLDDVTKVAESVLNRVVVEIVDMLDMEQLIDHVPINRVVARIDLPAVIEEIDLSGIVREGTKGLGGETLDSARSGLMAMDQWSARLVDRILRRKEPRDLSVNWGDGNHPETATPEVLA